MQVKLAKSFLKELDAMKASRPSLLTKCIQLKESISHLGFCPAFFALYDIVHLKDSYFRVRFPPYRIILRIDDDCVYFEALFKRKGGGDYKKYT